MRLFVRFVNLKNDLPNAVIDCDNVYIRVQEKVHTDELGDFDVLQVKYRNKEGYGELNDVCDIEVI